MRERRFALLVSSRGSGTESEAEEEDEDFGAEKEEVPEGSAVPSLSEEVLKSVVP
jgi:hypothetical protein